MFWCTGLVALWHVGSSRIRGRTHVSCIVRWILYHWATKEAPSSKKKKFFLCATLIIPSSNVILKPRQLECLGLVVPQWPPSLMMMNPRNLKGISSEAHIPSLDHAWGTFPNISKLSLYRLLPKFTLPGVDLLVCTALSPKVVKGSQGQLSGRDVVWIFRLSVHVQAYEGPYTAGLSGKWHGASICTFSLEPCKYQQL